MRARHVLRERERLDRFLALGRHDLDLGDAGRQRERGLQRVGETPFDPAPPYEAVDNHFDGVILVAGQTLARAAEVDDLAVDPRRVNPCDASSFSIPSYSPLRPRTIGASTWKRVPSGSCSTRSTICCGVWRVMTRPHSGQCAIPMRAYSRRR